MIVCLLTSFDEFQVTSWNKYQIITFIYIFLETQQYWNDDNHTV